LHRSPLFPVFTLRLHELGHPHIQGSKTAEERRSGEISEDAHDCSWGRGGPRHLDARGARFQRLAGGGLSAPIHCHPAAARRCAPAAQRHQGLAQVGSRAVHGGRARAAATAPAACSSWAVGAGARVWCAPTARPAFRARACVKMNRTPRARSAARRRKTRRVSSIPRLPSPTGCSRRRSSSLQPWMSCTATGSPPAARPMPRCVHATSHHVHGASRRSLA